MSTPAARARLDLTALDDRLVPSTVTSTATPRPFDFTGTGTLATTDPAGGGTTNAVNVSGRIDYTAADAGASGSVALSGTGTGTNAAGGTDAAARTFSQLVQAQFAFADVAGAANLTTPLAGTASWADGTSNGTLPVGPFGGTGALDTSTNTLSLALTGTDGGTGTLTATLADKTAAATDLSFSAASASLAADGTLSVNFTAAVTGKLMTAATHTAAAAHVTGSWSDGHGRTEAADLDVPLYWNTGRVVASARGLTVPDWATTFTLALDDAHAVAEANEGNNTWAVGLATLAPAAPPTGGTDGTGGAGTPPPATIPAPVGYTVSLVGDGSEVQWRDAGGQMTHAQPAFDGFVGTVSFAVGDVNHDGVLDVALGAGDGGAPRVRVLDGATGAVLMDAFVFEDSFRGGVTVALGDLDGDGKADLVVGAGAGGGPRVRALDVATGAVRYDFLAYEAEARGGVNVATVDLNGDGKCEIVTGAGVGGGPVIAVFDGADGAERQRVLAGPAAARAGARLTVTRDPDGHFVVSGDSDATGALTRFRQQLSADEPLLTELPDQPWLPGQPYGWPGLQG